MMRRLKGRRQWDGEPFVLFVEGYSDLQFYAEFLQHLGKHQKTFILDLGGNGRGTLANHLRAQLRPDRLERIDSAAILLDADRDPDAAFRSAAESVSSVFGVSISGSGAWAELPDADTKVGVFIAGGEQGTGEIETLVWNAWSSPGALPINKEIVESFLREASGGTNTLKKPDKSRIGALLSVLHSEDPRLGPAARAGVFDFASSGFARLGKFLEEL